MMIDWVKKSEADTRELSEFHTRGFLYDYTLGLLDHRRAKSVAHHLQQNPELARRQGQVSKALQYCQHLKQIQFSDERVAAVENELTGFDRLLLKMRMNQWSQGFRVMVETSLVIAVVFVFALMIPWPTLMSVLQEGRGTLVLSEVPRSETVTASQEPPTAVAQGAQESSTEFGDEGVPHEDLAALKKPVEALTGVPPLKEPALPAPIKATPAPTPDKVVPAASKPQEVTAAAPVPRNPARVAQGFLYRGRMTLTNVQATTPKLVAAVNDRGGRKAGQVPLGWSKGKGSYFHFTIPEAKYEELITALRGFGSLTITKVPHDRIMPEGIARVIIDVEEAKVEKPGTPAVPSTEPGDVAPESSAPGEP